MSSNESEGAARGLELALEVEGKLCDEFDMRGDLLEAIEAAVNHLQALLDSVRDEG